MDGLKRKPDEIKKALENAVDDCVFAVNCRENCAYERECSPICKAMMTDIPRALVADVLAYIQQLEEEKARLECSLTQLSSTIRHLREVESRVPRWISVEERLPEEKSRVLVCWFGHIFEATYLWFGNFETLNRELLLAGRDFTHWMPLPEQPEVDEK